MVTVIFSTECVHSSDSRRIIAHFWIYSLHLQCVSGRKDNQFLSSLYMSRQECSITPPEWILPTWGNVYFILITYHILRDIPLSRDDTVKKNTDAVNCTFILLIYKHNFFTFLSNWGSFFNEGKIPKSEQKPYLVNILYLWCAKCELIFHFLVLYVANFSKKRSNT